MHTRNSAYIFMSLFFIELLLRLESWSKSRWCWLECRRRLTREGVLIMAIIVWLSLLIGVIFRNKRRGRLHVAEDSLFLCLLAVIFSALVLVVPISVVLPLSLIAVLLMLWILLVVVSRVAASLLLVSFSGVRFIALIALLIILVIILEHFFLIFLLKRFLRAILVAFVLKIPVFVLLAFFCITVLWVIPVGSVGSIEEIWLLLFAIVGLLDFRLVVS